MKRIFASIIGTALLTFSVAGVGFPSQALAVDVFEPCNQSGGVNNSAVCKDVDNQKGSSNNPVIQAIKVVIQVLALIIGVTSVIIIIVSGLRMVSSSGDAQGVTTARNGILYAVIGLVVASLAQVLVSFVLNKL